MQRQKTKVRLRGCRNGGRAAVLNGADRESLPMEVTFKQRPEGGWVSHVGIWEKGCPRN